MSKTNNYDVIVVGAGGAGLAAGVSAAECGGRALVLECNSQPGGTTGIAIGSFTAAGTELQKAAGIDDDPDDHAVDAGKFAPAEIEARNTPELRRFFLGHAADTLRWIGGHGAHFIGPNPEPPNRQPRMHNVAPGAKAYIAALHGALLRHGGELLCDSIAESLILDDGRVVGVRANVQGVEREFRADRDVILAGGDYANNPDLIARFKGDRYRTIEGINPHALGHGHLLAESVGAKLLNMDVTYGPELRFVPSSRRPFQQWLPASGWRAKWMAAAARRMPSWILRRLIKRLLVTWQHPENSLFDDGAILINERGERFVDERSFPEREIAVSTQPDKLAYILLDERLAERYSQWPHFISTAPDIAYAYVDDYRRLRADVTAIGQLTEICRQRGVDESGARESLASTAMPGERFVLLGPVKAYFTTTEGGAAINERMQVLNENNEIIPGLRAVGQNGLGGMILWSHGLHIAWALTSGRLAGREAMGRRAQVVR